MSLVDYFTKTVSLTYDTLVPDALYIVGP